MKSKRTRLADLNWEALEGRSLQSGFGASFQVDHSSIVQPSLEQGNLIRPQSTNLTRDPGNGGSTQIIAILIG